MWSSSQINTGSIKEWYVPWEGHIHFFIHFCNGKNTRYKPLNLFHLCRILPHKNKKSNSDTVKICNASALTEVPKSMEELLCTVHQVKCWLTRKYNISTVAAYEYKSSNYWTNASLFFTLPTFLFTFHTPNPNMQILYLRSFHVKLHMLYSNDLQTCNTTWEYGLEAALFLSLM